MHKTRVCLPSLSCLCCLFAGFPVNGGGEGEKRESATLEECVKHNTNQHISCRRHGEASLKLKFNSHSFFVDDTRPQRRDKVMMGGRLVISSIKYHQTKNFV